MKNGDQPFFMRPPPRGFLLSVLLLGTVLIWHRSVGRGVLAALRVPFRVVKTVVTIVVTLPRLPALTRENTTLRSTLIQRELDIANLRETLRHTLQSQTLLRASPSPSGIVAVVLSRSPIPTQQTVLLDKGARDGLSLESVIIDAAGVIGRVIDVYPASSLVMLLTDPESRVAGLVERSREIGLLIGRSQGACEFIYLDATADIQEGDRIITAGLGETFPKGLLLGTVKRVLRDDASGVASAWIELAARLGQREEVLCLPSREPIPKTRKKL